MQMIPLQRHSSKKPKYRIFADWIRQQIESGALKADQQLLSYAEIEAQLGFSQNTVERAYAILERDNLICRVHGSGVFVKAATSPGTAKKSSDFIGYVDENFAQSKNSLYYTNLMQGAQQVAETAGKQLVVISSVQSFGKWEHLEGVILCSAGHNPNFSSAAICDMIPERLAVVNSLLPDTIVPSIVADDADGILQSVQHLVGLKHRRIAYLSQINFEPERLHPLVRLRYEAYLSALHHNGISPLAQWVFTPHSQEAPRQNDYYAYGYAGMKQWLQNGWEELGCTALLAHNDSAAMGAIDAFQEHGLDVPNDVSVIGFDGVEDFHTAPYDLTTIRIPLHEIGAETMRVLLQHMSNPLRTAKVTQLPVQLVRGHTTTLAPDDRAKLREQQSNSVVA